MRTNQACTFYTEDIGLKCVVDPDSVEIIPEKTDSGVVLNIKLCLKSDNVVLNDENVHPMNIPTILKELLDPERSEDTNIIQMTQEEWARYLEKVESK